MTPGDDVVNEAIANGLIKAYQLGLHEGVGAAAAIAFTEAERIKHTSHADGLGMGSPCCEAACQRVAAEILARDDK